MARGQQKIQSQQKNAKRAADAKRQEGHDQKKAAMVALKHNCTVCKVSLSSFCHIPFWNWSISHSFLKSLMPDLKTYKQHFENKHPKATMPEELKDVVTNWIFYWRNVETTIQVFRVFRRLILSKYLSVFTIINSQQKSPTKNINPVFLSSK